MRAYALRKIAAAPHSLYGTSGAHVIAKLCKAGEYRLQQLAFRLGIDRFNYRDDADILLEKAGLDAEVISDVTGQPIYLPNQQAIYSVCAVAAERQQLE